MFRLMLMVQSRDKPAQKHRLPVGLYGVYINLGHSILRHRMIKIELTLLVRKLAMSP